MYIFRSLHNSRHCLLTVFMGITGWLCMAMPVAHSEAFSPDPIKVTNIGHATMLIEGGDNRILTDPVFSKRISILKRHMPVGIKLTELPELTAILISHAHIDHFDMPTLAKLSPEVPIVVPRNIKGLARSLGKRKFVELSYWQEWTVGTVKITAVPARHYGGRWIIGSFFRKANGYIIEMNDKIIYFAGDTARDNGYLGIGNLFRIDLALLPIGAYRPRFIMYRSHISPAEALDVFKELDADFMIPIHWGVFRLSLEPLDEPVARLKERVVEQGLLDRVIVLNPGESWSSH